MSKKEEKKEPPPRERVEMSSRDGERKGPARGARVSDSVKEEDKA